MQTDPVATPDVGAGTRWSVMVVSLLATASSLYVHQRRHMFINGVAFLIPSLQGARDSARRSRSAGLDAQLGNGGHARGLGLRAGPGQRAGGDDHRLGADRTGRRLRRVVGALHGADRGVPVSRRHGGGRLQHGRRPAGVGLVPAAPARAGDGHPPNRATVGNRVGRHGHSRASRTRSAGGTALHRAGMRVRRGRQRDRNRRPAAQTPRQRSGTHQPISRVVDAVAMMPQMVTVTFMLVWLIRNLHWSVAAAGALVTLSQLLGALGRVAVGRWSDRLGSRMRPVRYIAAAAVLILLLLAWADYLNSRWQAGLMVAISVIPVLDNGLEATAITEFAGPYWSGRALGIQNTTQRIMAAAGPPLFGALISAAKYPPAWLLCALFPLAAMPLVPTRLLPPGLETRARRQSVRRLRWWRAVRSHALPDIVRRPGQPG
ncbi:integral membrane transport protein [Mycobacterium lepraemurium]|nr:integral membrane transport protein [Mycobacterium lepraemurium]